MNTRNLHDPKAFIEGLRHAKNLPSISWALCEELVERYPDSNLELMLCVAQLSLKMRNGDVCLHLCDKNTLKDGIFNSLIEALNDDAADARMSIADEEGVRALKELLYEKFGKDFKDFTYESLKSVLSCSALTHTDQDSQSITPLCFERGRLYLRRYLNYERDIANFVTQHGKMKGVVKDAADENFAKVCLDELFGINGDNRQKMAAALALLSNFTVISGGPGTGKTTTVSKLLLTLLACMLRRDPQSTPRIMLAAPTGKAAGRLGQSLEDQLKRPELQSFVSTMQKDFEFHDLSTLIPRRAETVHRLLGVSPHASSCRHDSKTPLNCDILIIDEVSMVDLPLFAKLCAAVPPKCVLILLGDKDQLTSVEAGSVLADLCSSLVASDEISSKMATLAGCKSKEKVDLGTMSDHVMLLTKSYRFKEDSGIGTLARLVNSDYDATKHRSGLETIFSGSKFKDIEDRRFKADEAIAAMRELVSYSLSSGRGYSPFYDYLKEQGNHMTPDTATIAFELLDTYRILCSNRNGLCGTKRLNAALSQRLRTKMLAPHEEWFAGRVVIVARNNPAVGVHNGDVGFCAYDDHDRLRVWFQGDDGNAKAVNPVYLTEVEDGYALTVHKSQGSEYDTVALCICEHDNSVLTRELIYTGITRAKKDLLIYAVTEILEVACSRTVQRESGLAERL